MEALLKTLKKEMKEYAVVGLMGLFIVYNMGVPSFVAELVDSLFGRVIVMVGALSLFFVHHVLGAVALVFAYELINRSEKKTGTYQTRTFLPSEVIKGKHFSAMNQFPATLEEEMVEKLVPISRKNLGEPEFKPVMDKVHDAAKL
jgi:hypothetical protein